MAVKRINGKIAPGYTENPNGRPPRAREAAYLLIMKEVADAKQWRALCQEALLGARGKKVYVDKDGTAKAIEDPDSTPNSRLAYLRFLADYLIGKPIQPLIVDSGEGEVLDEYMKLKDEELDVIIDAAKEKSTSIIRQARKLANRGMARKSRRNSSSGDNGAAGETATAKKMEADTQ